MSETLFDIILGLFAGLAMSGLIHSFASMSQDDSWREQITNHGCAEFYLDTNHDRQWHWTGEAK